MESRILKLVEVVLSGEPVTEEARRVAMDLTLEELVEDDADCFARARCLEVYPHIWVPLTDIRAIEELIDQGKKIPAIKRLKLAAGGLGLKESKDWVEDLIRREERKKENS